MFEVEDGTGAELIMIVVLFIVRGRNWDIGESNFWVILFMVGG